MLLPGCSIDGGEAILSAMNTFSKEIAQARIDDLHRDAQRTRMGDAWRRDDRPAARPLATPITIRSAAADDAAALRRVADHDSSELPAAPLVLADPFQHTEAAPRW